MPNLVKKTGVNAILKKPSASALASSTNCVECCCNCTGAAQPYSDGLTAKQLRWRYVDGNYGNLGIYTTCSFTISGSLTHQGFYSAPGTYVCGAGVGCDPRGTWTFSVPVAATSSGAIHHRYGASMVVCEDASWYYLQSACVSFLASDPGCANGFFGTVRFTNNITRVNKATPPVTTDGVWELVATEAGGCSVGGDLNGRSVTLNMAAAGTYYNVWRYQLGGTCGTSCNFGLCFPSPTPTFDASYSNLNPTISTNYSDYRSLTVACSLT